MKTRVLIAERDRASRNSIREMIGERGDFDAVGLARDSQEAIQLAMQLSPDVALIAYDLPGLTGMQTCEILSSLSPGMMIGLITDAKTPERMDKALTCGARAVIAKPLSADQLCALVSELAELKQRRESPETLEWADPARYPKIISVTGAKGGVGKSTIAANLATVMAWQEPDAVMLIDFYTQFGDMPTMFNFTPKGTIAEIMPVCADLDIDLVSSYVTRHSSGVHILVMSVEPLPPEIVDLECLDSLIYVLKSQYRYIIVDMPPMLYTTTLHVLTHSNMILLIANLRDLTTLTDTRKFYDTLHDERISDDSIGIVLNRISKANKLQLQDVQQMFGCQIVAHIPDDDKVLTAINEGRPAVLMDKRSTFTRGIEQIASAISLPPAAPKETAEVVACRKTLAAVR